MHLLFTRRECDRTRKEENAKGEPKCVDRQRGVLCVRLAMLLTTILWRDSRRCKSWI